MTSPGAREDARTDLAGRVLAGGVGDSGTIPMPTQTIGEADALTIPAWLAAGARPWGEGPSPRG